MTMAAAVPALAETGVAEVLAGAALLVLALAAGYAAGRRRGRQEGYRLGCAEAPLALRAEALVRGICPVCDHRTRARHDPRNPAPPGLNGPGQEPGPGRPSPVPPEPAPSRTAPAPPPPPR